MEIISAEVLKWLKENGYATIGEDYWFITDFPKDKTPDRLQIPINKRLWQQIRDGLNREDYEKACDAYEKAGDAYEKAGDAFSLAEEDYDKAEEAFSLAEEDYDKAEEAYYKAREAIE